VTAARPFLKWPGGKTQLLPKIRGHYPRPDSFDRYHEPFLGGGAVYFDLHARGLLEGKERFLSDFSAELVCAYLAVRDRVDELVDLLRDHAALHLADPKTHYYEVRADVPPDDVRRAARTIYLNKTCFNGLYRVNKKGEFNVSMGDYENPVVCDEGNLRACSAALAGARVTCENFSSVWGRWSLKRDFAYLDPPYAPASKTANFTSYTPERFKVGDHRELSKMFRQLDGVGCLLLLTSAASEDALALYEGFSVERVEARRCISCRGSGRGTVGELIVSNRRLDREVSR